MPSIRRSSIAIALCGMIAAPAVALADSTSTAPASGQVAVGQEQKPAERRAYEAETGDAVMRMDRRVEDIGHKDDVPRYDDLDSAWSSVKAQWNKVQEAAAEDWEQAKADFEKDWSEFRKTWDEVVAE